MTDNEIKKAWECCKKDKFEPHCSECPLEEYADYQIRLESEIFPLLNRQSVTKSEAIKEFAERLKEKFKCGDDVLYEERLIYYKIDDLVKEMVGEL